MIFDYVFYTFFVFLNDQIKELILETFEFRVIYNDSFNYIEFNDRSL